MLEFRAGKMVFEGKKVAPDTRKGLVRIAKVFHYSNSSLQKLTSILSNIYLKYFWHNILE